MLDELILNVVSTENPTDLDALINKDYDNVQVCAHAAMREEGPASFPLCLMQRRIVFDEKTPA